MMFTPSTAAHLRGCAMYFCIFMAFGCTDPFMPLIWRSKELSEKQIGVLGSVTPIASFLMTPIACAFADKYGIQQKMLYMALLMYIITRPSVLMAGSFFVVIAAEVSYSIARSPVSCLIDTAVRESSGSDGFGAQRLWGAAGYGVASLVGGIVCDSDGGYGGVMIFFVAVMIGAMVMSTRISMGNDCKFDKKIRDVCPTAIDTSSVSIKTAIVENYGGASEASSLPSASVMCYDAPDRTPLSGQWFMEDGNAKESRGQDQPQDGKENVIRSILSLMLGSLENASFFLAVILSGMAVGVIETFLFIRLEELGGSHLLCGLARAIMCITEIPLFYFSGKLMRLIGVQGVMVVAQVAYFVRLLYYSALENPWLVLPAESLHGLTFAAMWTATLEHTHDIAPESLRGTMRGVAAGLHWGLGFGLGALLGGSLYSELGPHLCFRVSAMLPPCSLFLLALPMLRSSYNQMREMWNFNGDLNDNISLKEQYKGCASNHLEDVVCGSDPYDRVDHGDVDFGVIHLAVEEGGKNLPKQQLLPTQQQ